MTVFRTLIAAVLFVSCASDPGVESDPPATIIFDTDMGSDCDDAGALALLHHYADQGLAEIAATVYSSGRVPYGAGVTEAINIYYGRPDIPVGAYHGDEVGDPVDKMQAEKLARDTTAFGNSIVHNHDAPDLTRLLREVLAGQPDSSVTYLTIGHTKGLYDLLVSTADSASPLDGTDLVETKVERWVALGALGAASDTARYAKDWNFFFNDAAPFTRYVVENIPVPAYFVDAGHDVLTGRSLMTTPPGNIVRTAYRDWLWNTGQRTLEDQRPSWDLAAVYYAVEGTGDFLVEAGEGWLEVDPEKGSRWHSGSHTPRQTFVRQRPGVDAAFAEYLNQRIAATPKRREIPASQSR